MRFNDLTFDEKLLTARRDDATNLRFTRKERTLLAQLIEKRGSLLARAQLLDALNEGDAETSERNIDFLVNRLRIKLGDDAREPRFIATVYGEGYSWIAKPDGERVLDAFLVVGPVYGLAGPDSAESGLLSGLVAALEAMMGASSQVVCAPTWRLDATTPHAVRYALEASFHSEQTALHAAFVLRHGPTRQMIRTFRATFTIDPDHPAIADVAARVQEAIWAHIALPTPFACVPTDTPLEIRMHDAALMLARTPESWRESEAQIEKARTQAPNDPALAVMRGLALYARLIQQVGAGKRPSPREWADTEDEIEALALACLPAIQDNPLLVLGVAKLLVFVDRGHFELAEQLADEAFARSTAFAAAFATQGQLRMCRGSFDEALALYDKGIEISEPGSEFRVYLMILKCTALLAADDRPALQASCEALYATKPVTRMQVGLVMAPPDAAPLPPDLEALLAAIGEDSAQRTVTYLYQVSARHFRSTVHRENVMRGLLTHLQRRFGPAILPDDIAQALPSLVDAQKATIFRTCHAPSMN